MAKDGLIIPLVIDENILKSSLNSVNDIINSSFNDILSDLDKLNKKSIFSLNITDLNKNIKEIENKMARLSNSREIVLKKPNTKDTKKILDEIENRLKNLAIEKKINLIISSDITKDIERIKKDIEFLLNPKNEILFIPSIDISQMKWAQKELEDIFKEVLNGSDDVLKSLQDAFNGSNIDLGALQGVADEAMKLLKMHLNGEEFDFGSFDTVGTGIIELIQSGLNGEDLKLSSFETVGRGIIELIQGGLNGEDLHLGSFQDLGDEILKLIQGGLNGEGLDLGSLGEKLQGLFSGEGIDLGSFRELFEEASDIIANFFNGEGIDADAIENIANKAFGSLTKFLGGKGIDLGSFQDLFGKASNIIGDAFGGEDFKMSTLEMAELAKSAFDGITGYISGVFQKEVDDIQNELSTLDDVYAEESEKLQEKYEADLEALDEKYEAEQEAYDEQIETLGEQREENQEELDEINSEIEELEKEKTANMVEEDFLALQEKIDNKRAEAVEKEAVIAEIEVKEQAALNNKALSETNYNISKQQKEIEFLQNKETREKEYLNKKATLERKLAESNKKLQLFNAIISTATGIANGIASGMATPLPIVFAPLYAGMAALMGGLQIAAIISTPLPEVPSFSDGGIVPTANDYLYPHIPRAKNGKDRTLAWLQTGEAVVPKNEVAMYKDYVLYSNQRDINSVHNYDTNTTQGDVYNNYDVNVNVASTGARPADIAKAVVKSIRGRA